MTDQNKKFSGKLKAVIVILAVLLICSIGALVFRVIYLNLTQQNGSTAVVSDNLIGEKVTSDTDASAKNETADANGTESVAEPSSVTPRAMAAQEESSIDTTAPISADAAANATVIELYRGQSGDNEAFRAENMLPGDYEVKYYAVKVSHHAEVTVFFQAEVTAQTKGLADVLHIKVTQLESGRVIYQGPLSSLPADEDGTVLAATQSTESVAYYKIEVSLPGDTGNEYQGASLTADFIWSVRDTGSLDSPITGDLDNTVLYIAVAGVSLALVIIVLFAKRKERGVESNAR